MMKTLVHKHIIHFQTMGLVVAREAENDHISISIGHSWEVKWAELSLLFVLDEMHEEARPQGPSIRHHCTELGLLALSSSWTNCNTWKAFSDILQILSKSAAQPALCRWWLCSHGGINQHPTFSKLSSLSPFHWVPPILVLFRDLGLGSSLIPWSYPDSFCISNFVVLIENSRSPDWILSPVLWILSPELSSAVSQCPGQSLQCWSLILALVTQSTREQFTYWSLATFRGKKTKPKTLNVSTDSRRNKNIHIIEKIINIK